MDKADNMTTDETLAISEFFGPLSVTMLQHTPLAPVWRVAFIANFFTGPLYQEVQERFGISRPDFVILFCLAQGARLVARDIGLVTGLPKNSISRAVSALLKAELIERERDANDKREKPLSLTVTGQELLEQVVPLFEKRQRALFAALSDQEQAEYDRLSNKIIARMPKWVSASSEVVNGQK